ncbi:MAG: O-antigen ligase family protein [Roseiflexaceae bacterium]
MSDVIPIMQTPASLSRWLVAVSRLGFVGMALGLAVFYKSHDLPVMLIGLLIFGLFALLQPDLALLFVLGTVPLFMIPAQIDGLRAQPVRLPLHEVALLLVTGAGVVRWLGSYVWNGTQLEWAALRRLPGAVRRWSASHIPAVILLLAGVLGVVWAVPEGRSAALRELRWLIIEPLLFYILLTAAFRRRGALGKRSRAYALGAFILSGSVVAVVGLLQFIGVDLVWFFGAKQVAVASIVDAPGLWRVTSVYGSPNNLGLYLGRVWPLAAVMFMAAWKAKPAGTYYHWKHTGLFAIATLLCLTGLIVSFSRGAWLGMGTALLVLVFPQIRRHHSRRRVVGVIALGFTLALIIGLAFSLRGGITSANPLMRLSFWREALMLIQQHPLGIGLDQFFYYHNPVYGRSLLSPLELTTVDTTAAHPHNLILDFWLRVGPLGSAACAWLLWRFFQQTRAQNRANQDGYSAWLARGALAAMAAALVHGLVDNFYFVPDLAFAFWLLLALAETYRAEP